MRQPENALYLVYKIVRRLSFSWRPLSGGPNLMAMVAAGEVFRYGIPAGIQGSEMEVMTARRCGDPERKSTPIDKWSNSVIALIVFPIRQSIWRTD